MKRLLGILLLVGCVGIALAVTGGQATKVQGAGDAYHILLMLDQRETVEHAKALNYYLHHRTGDLDRDVLGKHVDELSRNLTGMQDELEKIENRASFEKVSLPPQVAQIREAQLGARLEFEALKMEALKPDADVTRLEAKSLAIYDQLRLAAKLHEKMMETLRVELPGDPVRSN
jgi:hypothetical protein